MKQMSEQPLPLCPVCGERVLVVEGGPVYAWTADPEPRQVRVGYTFTAVPCEHTLTAEQYYTISGVK